MLTVPNATALDEPDRTDGEPATFEIWTGSDLTAENRFEWTALERTATDTYAVFQSLAWCDSWTRVFAQRAGGPDIHIYALRRGEAVTGLLPMMAMRHGGVRVLTSLGEPHTQISNALFAPGCPPRDDAALLLAALEKTPEIDLVHLPRIPVTSPLFKALPAAAFRPDPAVCMHMVNFDGIEDGTAFQASLSKNRRKDFRRKLSHLHDMGEVSYAIHPAGSKRYARLARETVVRKRAWLRENGIVSAGLSPGGVPDFMAGMEAMPGGFQPEAGCLTLDGKTIGLELSLTGKGMRHCHMSVYDPAYSHLSAGMLTHLHGILASADAGLDGYNFLGFPSPFKAAWTNRTIDLVTYAKPLTVKGRLYQRAWNDGVRPLAKKALGSLRGFGAGRMVSRVVSGRRDD